jgi:hypothetical protein
MRIVDYETSRTLNDVGIFLTLEEAEELCVYLRRMTKPHPVQRAHLSELHGNHLEREITVSLDEHCGRALAS